MNDPEPNNLLSIARLAQQTSVSTRTIRYYVQRGLIDAPLGRGRGSHYSETHIEQIQRIRRLQREGVSLDSIGRLGDEPEASAGQTQQEILPVPEVVFRIPLGPGVRLEIDATAAIPAPKVLDRLALACNRILMSPSGSSDEGKPPVTAGPDQGDDNEPR